jgi:hypothetical protein
MCIAWETSNTNLADLLLTKNLMDPFISWFPYVISTDLYTKPVNVVRC